LSPGFQGRWGDLAVGSTDQKVKILFAPVKFSLSPMRCLARRAELFWQVPADGLHHAHAREYHRAIVLSGVGHHAGGGLDLWHCVLERIESAPWFALDLKSDSQFQYGSGGG
jgi:hypothetical protein